MNIGTGIYLDKFLKNPTFYKENYNYLEIQDFLMPANLDSFKNDILNKYIELLKDYKGTVTLHGPYIDLKPSSFDPLVREVCLKRYSQVLDIAMRLKSPYLVIHSDYDRNPSYEGYNDYFIDQTISL